MATLNDEYTTPASGAASLAGRGGSTEPGLPAVSQAAPVNVEKKIVGKGPIQDQLVSWSNEYGTDPGSILRENNITNTGDIKPGQVLTIPSGKTNSSVTQGLIDAPEEDETESLMSRIISGFDIGGKEQFEDYSTGKVGVDGGEFSLEGKGEAFAVKPKPVAEQIGFEERVNPETGEGTGTYTFDAENISNKVPISEAIQLGEGGVTTVPGMGEVPLAPPPEEVEEVKPSITGTEVAAIPGGSSATSVSTPTDPTEFASDVPPTEDELTKLIAMFEPLGTGKEYYNGVIANIKAVELPNTFDAKALYQQLAEDAERETKKIDDSIAEIAEEKIKPTFAGFDKFLAVLGAALGAYGSAMTGTPNYALQIMNKAIDADQEQFLASKEIRTKTLLGQRQAVLQRRSDLLQLGINQADRMLAIAQKNQDNQLAVANLEGIKLELENNAVTAKNAQIAMLIEMRSKKIIAQNLAEKAQIKDQRGRSVEAVTLKDGSGNLIEMPGYFAKTEAEAIKLRETSGFGNQIQDVLDKLDTLADETGKLPLAAQGPKFISETRTKVAALTNELIIKLKDFYGMGANFTEYEQTLIQALTPTDAWLEKWKMWKVKSNNLRDTIVRTHKSKAATQGARLGNMPTTSERPKAKGQKIGVSN